MILSCGKNVLKLEYISWPLGKINYPAVLYAKPLVGAEQNKGYHY